MFLNSYMPFSCNSCCLFFLGLRLPGGLKLPRGLKLPGGLKLPRGLKLPGGLRLFAADALETSWVTN